MLNPNVFYIDINMFERGGEAVTHTMRELVASPFLRHQRWLPEIPSLHETLDLVTIVEKTITSTPTEAFGPLSQAVQGVQFQVALPVPYSLESSEFSQLASTIYGQNKCIVLRQLFQYVPGIRPPMENLYGYIQTLAATIKKLPPTKQVEPKADSKPKKKKADMERTMCGDLPIINGEFLPLVEGEKTGTMDATMLEHSEYAWLMREAIAPVVVHMNHLVSSFPYAQPCYTQVSPLYMAGHNASTGRKPNECPNMLLPRWHAAPELSVAVIPEAFGIQTHPKPFANPTSPQAYYVVTAAAGSCLHIVPKIEELMKEIIWETERAKEVANVELYKQGNKTAHKTCVSRYEFSPATVQLIEDRKCALEVKLEAGMLIMMHEAMPRKWTLTSNSQVTTVIIPVSMFQVRPEDIALIDALRMDEYTSGQYSATSKFKPVRHLPRNSYDYLVSWSAMRREASLNAEYSSYLKKRTFDSNDLRQRITRNNQADEFAIRRAHHRYYVPYGSIPKDVLVLEDHTMPMCPNCDEHYEQGVILTNMDSPTGPDVRLCASCYQSACEESEAST